MHFNLARSCEKCYSVKICEKCHGVMSHFSVCSQVKKLKSILKMLKILTTHKMKHKKKKFHLHQIKTELPAQFLCWQTAWRCLLFRELKQYKKENVKEMKIPNSRSVSRVLLNEWNKLSAKIQGVLWQAKLFYFHSFCWRLHNLESTWHSIRTQWYYTVSPVMSYYFIQIKLM